MTRSRHPFHLIVAGGRPACGSRSRTMTTDVRMVQCQKCLAKATKRQRTRLAINRCPVHSDFWSISVDDPNDGTGTRITPSKCCGRWETVKWWTLDGSIDVDELVAAAKRNYEER